MGGKLTGGVSLDLTGISYPARQLLGSPNSAAHSLLVARKYRIFTRTASSKHETARPGSCIYGFVRFAPTQTGCIPTGIGLGLSKACRAIDARKV